MTRTIGIVHRVKRTREQEAHPTRVAILHGDTVTTYELEDETAELDFLKAEFPVAWRKVEAEEDVSSFTPRHCKWRRLKKDEDVTTIPAGHVRSKQAATGKTTYEVLSEVPKQFEGLASGDAVAMTLGGSGDRFAAALSRQGEEISASVFRIPPHNFKEYRGKEDKSSDHELLARYLREVFDRESADMRPFYLVRAHDRSLIRVKETLDLRQNAMKARIGCSQRILQKAIGQVFLSEEGKWPEGRLEEHFQDLIANDAIFQQLEAEEKRYEREMHAAVKALPIWSIFDGIKGCGPRIAAGIVAAIGDVRRFQVTPSPERMQELYAESQRLEQEGNFRADLDKVAGQIKPGDNQYRKLQKVSRWKRTHGKEAEADLLDQAIKYHEKRSKLRRKARKDGQAKLKAFCGVYPQVGGKFGDNPKDRQFPRRRKDQVANWNPLARQSLYLLADQFNRNPGSEWGQRLLQEKAKLRETHPEPIEVEGKNGRMVKRYTDGHIHRMAMWKTLSKFVEWLFEEWMRIEEAHNGSNRRRSSAA